jgi:hypothetical protein
MTNIMMGFSSRMATNDYEEDGPKGLLPATLRRADIVHWNEIERY